jgi:hypothetical protein
VVRRAASLSPAAGNILSLALILCGVAWALRSPQKLRSLSSLYLWLAFILLLDDPTRWLPVVPGWDPVLLYEILSGAHLLLILMATFVLGAWKNASPARLASGLFIAGAVIFWSGARIWPGMSLTVIAEHRPEHLWTSSTFLLGTIVTLAGMALFRLALQQAGDRFWAMLGLLAYLFGAVFFAIHLGFRLTVMPLAVEEFRRVGAAPDWYEPWRIWAGLGFGIYHVFAYLALIFYGIALLKTRLLPRAAGWSCVISASLLVPWFGPPLLIHMMPWILGALILTRDAHVPGQLAPSGWPEASVAAVTKVAE